MTNALSYERPKEVWKTILHPNHQSITVYPDNKHFASAAERVDASVGTLRSNDADGNEKVKKKNNWFNKQNNNFARSSHFFCTFLNPFLHD